MSPTSYQTAPPRVAPYVVANRNPAEPRPARRRVRAEPLLALADTASMRRMRVAVVDIGTNSTRLLIADVDAGAGSVTELLRRSEVTRLGEGVDASGSLSEEAAGARLREARRIPRGDRCAATARPTWRSSRRPCAMPANGAGFAERVRTDYGLDARVLSGEEEAQLTFLGAMSGRPASSEPIVVIDIGGGSTEFIIGRGRSAGFHVSLPIGVVRMSERHIRSDPPAPAELQELSREVQELLARRHSPARAGRREGRDRGRRHGDLGSRNRPGARPLRPGAGGRIRADAGDGRTAPGPAR